MKRAICEECYLKQGCEAPCAAIDALREIYSEARMREKKKLIKALRQQLGIVDAEVAPDLEVLGKQIIKRVPELRGITDFEIKVGYVRSFERKTKDGKIIYADCRKVNKVYGAYLPFDFVITFYEMNIGVLSENQLKILMWHELKHIAIGERGFVVRPHDIEDFYSITDAHTTRWGEFGMEVKDILR